MTKDIKADFWDRLKDTRAGMLSADGAPAVPMSHHIDEENDGSVLWFITNKHTDLAQATAKGVAGQYIVSSKDEQLYARIDGRLSQEKDLKQLDRIWNSFAAAWFEDGRQDDDIALMKFELSKAEVWITGGSLKFLYEVAKANTTGSVPDVGDHDTVIF
ncbi:MAG: pyridoxamine 5'-phosphate oxidase family protein [Sulfitobacter sp.]|nr:pyridoxamine 5'-phosphate oxidase family protein [Sulfitobacter sp.]